MAETKTPNDIFDPLVRRLIRESARDVIDNTGLPRYEQEDIEQDLRFHYWSERGGYRADRGARSTFAKVVIRRKAAALAIRARAGRRSGVHIPMSIDGCPEVDPDSREGRTLCASAVNGAIADGALNTRSLDVRRAIASMNRNDRLLVRRLMQWSITETVRSTGIPRSTVYDRIKRIRTAFIAAGVGPMSCDIRTVVTPTD